MGGVTVFPFHEACYGLLSRAIKGTIDNELIYSAFVRLSNEFETWMLDIDYGDPPPRDNRDWISVPGTELLVKNPAESIDMSPFLVQQAPAALPCCEGCDSLSDPFNELPIEIRQQLMAQLPLLDISALRQASKIMFETLPSKTVWTRVLTETMPWLWEMDDVLSRGEHHRLDLIQTIKKLQTQTEYSFDGINQCLTLANRRRVWSVCEQIAVEYKKLNYPTSAARKWIPKGDGCFELLCR
ncbi:hypothetical protein DCS_04051 [Drechmeria coniospora]|uniref:F-box domain-containing protein n=1 Tax=Drechmeria coniospora TaxID=98403 RepID=A0A151GIX4_DRECN|nr:hypothetical protein DCS_04051 [Drechmeria coniospora]KYK57044.1 hypothetical protein DCS_04051 [Drechmeria coniospora]